MDQQFECIIYYSWRICMSPTCPEFRWQVRGHGCCHQNQRSQSFLKLHTVLQHPDCCTLNTHSGDKCDFQKSEMINVTSLFQGTGGGHTHIQCIGKSHQARNGCVEEELLCEVRRHLIIITQKNRWHSQLAQICFGDWTSSCFHVDWLCHGVFLSLPLKND